MQLGFLGLGQMGHNLVLNLMDKGHQIVAWNRSPERREAARRDGITVVDDISQVVAQLTGPRVIWMMISAGPGIDEILFGEDGLANKLSAGDVIVDGANSHYSDTKRRASQLAARGIMFVDCGVSGGVAAARKGVCVMAGGDQSAYTRVEPVIKDMSQAEGYGYFGSSGAGHYVKMVHNAIEYGMMQSLAEGINLLQKSEYATDIAKLTGVWNQGSVIQSNLLGFLHDAASEDPQFNSAGTEIGDLGTGSWATVEALKQGVPFTSIANAVFTRYQSRDSQSLLYRIISALRMSFGGHGSAERPAEVK